MNARRAHRGLRVLLAGVAFWTAAPLSSARAEVQRYAVLIGVNIGEPGEPELRYAERDAEKVGSVLRRLGRVPPENLVMLLDADAVAVERALVDVGRRVAEAERRDPEVGRVVFVYYSGHADAGALHARGSRLDFGRLRELLEAIRADVRVVVIDACQSGGITRVKGAEPAAPFKIEIEERLSGEGMAIITSAAETEEAQESDRLRGSFFTHHFVAGLRGAADASGDHRVTLAEAYQHAYTETLRATSLTRHVQHPTYSFDIRGRRDLVLTSLDEAERGVGHLLLPDAGSYVLFEGDEGGAVAAELVTEGSTQLALDPGSYLVRRRGRTLVHESPVRVREGELATVSVSGMRQIPYGQVVRKGLGEGTGVVWAVLTGAGIGGEIVPGVERTILATAGVQMDFEPVSLQVRFRYGYGTSTNDTLSMEQHLFGVDAAVLKILDVWELAIGFGIRVGGDWVRQEFASSGDAPSRGSWIWRAGALVDLSYSPLPWLSIFLEGGADANILRATAGEPGDEDWKVKVSPFGVLGLRFHL